MHILVVSTLRGTNDLPLYTVGTDVAPAVSSVGDSVFCTTAGSSVEGGDVAGSAVVRSGASCSSASSPISAAECITVVAAVFVGCTIADARPSVLLVAPAAAAFTVIRSFVALASMSSATAFPNV